MTCADIEPVQPGVERARGRAAFPAAQPQYLRVRVHALNVVHPGDVHILETAFAPAEPAQARVRGNPKRIRGLHDFRGQGAQGDVVSGVLRPLA